MCMHISKYDRHIQVTNWKIPNGVSGVFGVSYVLTALMCVCILVNMIVIFRLLTENTQWSKWRGWCILLFDLAHMCMYISKYDRHSQITN